MNKNKTV